MTRYSLKNKIPNPVYLVEYCTQPLSDFLKWYLYHLYWKFMWKSHIEQIQEYILKKHYKWDSLNEDQKVYVILNKLPGVFRDLRVDSLDRKNLRVYKRVGGSTKWPA